MRCLSHSSSIVDAGGPRGRLRSGAAVGHLTLTGGFHHATDLSSLALRRHHRVLRSRPSWLSQSIDGRLWGVPRHARYNTLALYRRLVASVSDRKSTRLNSSH